jgi:ribosomal protein S18 acetylase RimI-like enzyme
MSPGALGQGRAGAKGGRKDRPVADLASIWSLRAMTRPFHIRPAREAADLRATAALFEAYAASLPIDLGYQGFASELAELPGRYAPPRGELLLAVDGEGAAIGCVGLREIQPEGCCEMKRLYLSPAARGLGLGRALTEAVIEAARHRGYLEMRLDTLASMAAAISLYEQLGFSRIEPYYAPTPAGTVFMARNL